jgi:nucleotide-binding universal stress UspA family protein
MSVFPTKVLLATDGSAEAELALQAAVELAGKTGSQLHLIHVWSVPFYYHPERHGYSVQYEKQHEEAQRLLNEQGEKVRVAGGVVAEAHLGIGPPDQETVMTAEDIGAGLIVMGSRGLSGISRSLLGGVSDSVMRHAHCPVLVVRSPGREAGAGREEGKFFYIFPTKILVATDGSPSSARAVREAAELARQTDSELHIVHVLPVSALYSSADVVLAEGIPLYEESREKVKRTLAEDVERAKEAGAPAAKTHLLEGKPDARVVALAEDIGAGLIVVGSRGLGALSRALVGSTSTSIVRHAHCPVLVIRNEEKELI